MATSSNLSSIIKFYSEKTKSPFIDFGEFCSYIKKYAEHHLEENEELVKYLETPANTVTAELQGLSEKHLVSVITSNSKKIIVYLPFFTNKILERYNEIKDNSSIPYPIISDLPENFPIQSLELKSANQYISSIVEKNVEETQSLYIMEFEKDISALLLPSSVPIKVILETAQQKIRKVLKKEEYHDYFLKKLRTTNPTKEISIRTFYADFVDNDIYKYKEFQDGDDYYIWNQTLYYISQDFIKIQDRTAEDISILQACQILEIYSSYLKEKFQKEKERAEALKELKILLKKSPFFFSINQIIKFQDRNGNLLYGKYLEEDLKTFLQKETTEGKNNELPPLLIFKVSDNKYYIYKEYISSVADRFCNEAHISIEKELEEEWYEALKDFERLPEMNNSEAFEQKLKKLIKKNSPVLYSLLNANFMKTLAYDKKETISEGFNLFANGHLLSYSELLMLDQNKILSNARLRLPIYYTLPIISWIIGFFHKLKIQGLKKQNKKNPAKDLDIEKEEPLEKKSKQDVISSRAEEIVKEIIPEGSTIDRELDYLLKQWNIMLAKDAYKNLTEDVNSLIRDYTRKTMRSLSAVSFSRERIENLAETLVNTPVLGRIPDKKALKEYVILYILRLLSNL